MAQLAEMGVAIPDEYRGAMALVGEWQVVSENPAEPNIQAGSEKSLNIGVRKRKFDGDEEIEAAGEVVQRKIWGSTTKSYPDKSKTDLDALLSGSLPVQKDETALPDKSKGSDLDETGEKQVQSTDVEDGSSHFSEAVAIKQEDAPEAPSSACQPQDHTPDTGSLPETLFKKRKSKSVRQK
jgi:hypothetical protein